MTTKDEAAKRPRADAQKNRGKLLEVAEGIFDRKGFSASTEEIAAEAGVGAGTLFRHFPSKEKLFEALLIARLERLTEEARARLGEADAGGAFYGLLSLLLSQARTKRSFVEALSAAGADVRKLIAPAGLTLRQTMEGLLIGAQKVGAVRADVGISEVMSLVVGAAAAAEHVSHDASLQARVTALCLEVLRPR